MQSVVCVSTNWRINELRNHSFSMVPYNMHEKLTSMHKYAMPEIFGGTSIRYADYQFSRRTSLA